MSERLHWPAGTLTAGGDPVEVTPSAAGWRYTGLSVIRLSPGLPRRISTGNREMLVLPLSGGCSVEGSDFRYMLEGRDGVFEGITDFAYLPVGAEVVLSSANGAELALPRRWRTDGSSAAHVPASDVGGGGARSGKRHPPGQQLLRRRWRAGAPAGGGRGIDARRQLVLLSRRTSTTRGRAGRSGAGGDLLLPHRRARRLRRFTGPTPPTAPSTRR